MKKYIILVGLVLLSLSVQAQNDSVAKMQDPAEKQGVEIAKEKIQAHKKMRMEHTKERPRFRELTTIRLNSRTVNRMMER